MCKRQLQHENFSTSPLMHSQDCNALKALFNSRHAWCRLALAAAEALGLATTTAQDNGAGAGAHARQRMRELSMLVHPDKCSLAGAEEVSILCKASVVSHACIFVGRPSA